MSTKEIQEGIIANMKRWQKIEDAAVASTGQIIEKTNNPIVRLVMEIIQRDSLMHHRVEEMIAESLESKPVTLAPDELGEVSAMIEKHNEIELQTVELAKSSLAALKGRKMLVQEYLLNYLLQDESKHASLLAALGAIKRSMYPYA